MAQDEKPQVYLVTPTEFELSQFSATLPSVLDTAEIACLRLNMATRDEDRISRAADALREICHARDVAIVIDSHILLAQRLGLDGVHLLDGSRSVRKTRKELGDDAIIGAFCAASKHDGMTAGEASADYVSFGPIGQSPLGDGTQADFEIFEWWSQMIEVPVVAEGALTIDLVRSLSPVTDFFAFGDEIWTTEQPSETLKALIQAM